MTTKSITESSGYPSSDTPVSDALYHSLLDLPDSARMDLEWFRAHVWPDATSFTVPRSSVIQGMQANMFQVVLTDAKCNERKLIGKRVVPKELPPKANLTMWKQFVASVERELHFYDDLQHEDASTKTLFPRCYYTGQIDVSDQEILTKGHYFLLLEDVSGRFYQNASLNRTQAMSLMKALATFHAHFWGRVPESVERGGFWTMERRRPLKEVENAKSTWSGLLERLPELRDSVPDCDDLAEKLASKADQLDRFVSENCFTRIHGDAKGWNLFLGSTNPEEILLIDLQWTGRGHPLQDVAYSLTTSLDADLLADLSFFVDYYIDCLIENELPTSAPSPAVLRSHFDLVWLDYARVIVTGLWKRLSKDQMVKYANVVGPSMITKSWPHIQFIVKRIHQKLEVEKIVK